MHEKFMLDEGEVSLSFPADLSIESFQDFEARLGITLRAAKRRVEARKLMSNPVTDQDIAEMNRKKATRDPRLMTRPPQLAASSFF
jgi:hypothetical protein